MQFPEDARVHYIVLKQQTTPTPTPRTNPAPAPASHKLRPHLACNPKTQERTRTTHKNNDDAYKHRETKQTTKKGADIPPMSKPPTRHSRAAWPTKQ